MSNKGIYLALQHLSSIIKVKGERMTDDMRKFYVGLKNKLVVISQENEQYKFSVQLVDKKINQLAFNPENKNHIYAATHAGLWQTKDGGIQWEKIESNLPLIITSVAIHPVKNTEGHYTIYAGTEPTQLFYSVDSGETWHEFKGIQQLPSKQFWSFPPRPETHYARWITPSYHNVNQLALSIEAGAVIRTQDHGKTWQDRAESGPIDVHTLLAHPNTPNHLYAANGDGSGNSKKAYAESKDWGETWIYKSEGLEGHPYLYHMVLNSQDATERLVSASKNATAAHRKPRYSTVYRKRGEAAWIELGKGLPKKGAYTHHLAADPPNPGAYYALNNYGIYYLAQKEEHWQQPQIDTKAVGLDQRAYFFTVQ